MCCTDLVHLNTVSAACTTGRRHTTAHGLRLAAVRLTTLYSKGVPLKVEVLFASTYERLRKHVVEETVGSARLDGPGRRNQPRRERDHVGACQLEPSAVVTISSFACLLWQHVVHRLSGRTHPLDVASQVVVSELYSTSRVCIDRLLCCASKSCADSAVLVLNLNSALWDNRPLSCQ